MIQINAVLKPFKSDDVCEALWEAGFSGYTLMDCEGPQKRAEIYRGSEYTPPDRRAHKMLVIVVADVDEAYVYDIIRKASLTGKPGDGIIWSTGVKAGLHISTGEALEVRIKNADGRN